MKALDDWLKEAQREHGCSLKAHGGMIGTVLRRPTSFGRGGNWGVPGGLAAAVDSEESEILAVPALKSLILR